MQNKDLKKLLGTAAFRAETKKVFFEAVNAPKKDAADELPDSKLIPPYIRGSWKVVDTYLVSPLNSWSGGMTVISYGDMPVWVMQYFGDGEYREASIPWLKAALYDGSDFGNFAGCGNVEGPNGTVGWCSYQGGFLV
ncbi:MAG: hypothetical protein Q7R58_01655 [bacterium]|nr:hypothetical protein [bacterium]